MAEGNVLIEVSPVLAASLADLADAAQGIRVVLEKLDKREEQQREEDKHLDANEANEYWTTIRQSLPKELADGLFDWFSSRPNATWAMYKLAQHYHWSS